MAAALLARTDDTWDARFRLMEHKRGPQRDCHPVREEGESLLDVEAAQASPPIRQIASVSETNGDAHNDRLARPERQARDGAAAGRPRTFARQVQHPAGRR